MKDKGEVVQSLSYEEFLSSEAKDFTDSSPENSKKKRKRRSNPKRTEKRLKSDDSPDLSLSPNNEKKDKNSSKKEEFSISRCSKSNLKSQKIYDIFTKSGDKLAKTTKSNKNYEKITKKLKNHDCVVDLTSPKTSNSVSKTKSKNPNSAIVKQKGPAEESQSPPMKRKRKENGPKGESFFSQKKEQKSAGNFEARTTFFDLQKKSNTSKQSKMFLNKDTAKSKTSKKTKISNSSAKTKKQLRIDGSRKITNSATADKKSSKLSEKERKSSSDGIVFVGEVKSSKPVFDSPMKTIFPPTRNVVCDLPALENETILWTEKYEPICAVEIAGNSSHAEKMSNWLKEWKKRWEKEKEELERQEKGGKDEKEDSDSDFDLDEDDKVKLKKEEDSFARCGVVIGPFGCGKTASIYACAKELSFKVFEMNASSQRSSKQVLSQLHEATQSHQVSKSKQSFNFFAVKNDVKKPPQNSLILFEDVDVLFDEDKYFWSAVQNLISATKRPIILTTSDGGILRNLDQNYEKFLFGPIAVTKQLSRLQEIARNEHFSISDDQITDVKIANQILKCDLRKTIHNIHFWFSNIATKTTQNSPKIIEEKKTRKTRRSRGKLKYDADSEKSIAVKTLTNISNFSSKICGIHDILFKSDAAASTDLNSDIGKLCQLLHNCEPSQLSVAEDVVSIMLSSKLPPIILLNWFSLLPSCGEMKPQFSVGKTPLEIHVPPTFVARDVEMEFSSYDFTVEESFTPHVQEPMDFLIDEDSVDRCYPVHANYNQYFPVQTGNNQMYPYQVSYNQFNPVQTGRNISPYVYQPYPAHTTYYQPHAAQTYYPHQNYPNQLTPVQTGHNQSHIPQNYYPPQNCPNPVQTGHSQSHVPQSYYPPQNYHHPYPVQTGFNQSYPVQAGPHPSSPTVQSYPAQSITPNYNVYNHAQPARFYPATAVPGQYHPVQTSSNQNFQPFQTRLQPKTHSKQLNESQAPLNAASAISPDPTGSNHMRPVKTSSDQQNQASHVVTNSDSMPKYKKVAKNRAKCEIKTLQAISDMADICCFSDIFKTSISRTQKSHDVGNKLLDDTRCKIKDGLGDFLPKITEISHQAVETSSDLQAAVQVRAMSRCCVDFKNALVALKKNFEDFKTSAELVEVEKNTSDSKLPENKGLKEMAGFESSEKPKKKSEFLNILKSTEKDSKNISTGEINYASRESKDAEPSNMNNQNSSTNNDSTIKLFVPDSLELRLPYEGKTRKNNQFMRHSLQSQFSGGMSVTPSVFVIDFLPAIRSICRSEDVRKNSKKKRRFLHYLNSIKVFPKPTELNKLVNDYKEVILEK
ncbi:uncharacterized protein LOC120344526 [Styela clava]